MLSKIYYNASMWWVNRNFQPNWVGYPLIILSHLLLPFVKTSDIELLIKNGNYKMKTLGMRRRKL